MMISSNAYALSKSVSFSFYKNGLKAIVMTALILVAMVTPSSASAVTFIVTPSVPTNGQPHATTLNTNSFTFTWDDSTDDQAGAITYEFQSSMNPAQSGGVLTNDLWQSGTLSDNLIVSNGAPDGTWYWQVRAKDAAGNYSNWSTIWNVTLNTSTPPACNASNTFDTFTLGSVNGQGGWSSSGPFDHKIVTNLYGFPTFGCRSLRISNAITSGSFGDQTFSNSITNEAGEPTALNGGMSGGTRKTHFDAQFDFASTQATQQQGLFLSVSPDRGDGSRMSYLGFADNADGIDVIFYDVQGEGNPANFVPTTVATGLSRATTHTAKFEMDFLPGASNDVVKIYIDGVLVHTGTSWENYYRFDAESQGNPHDASLENISRTVDSLLFRTGGDAAPVTQGKGYLIDNVDMTSMPSTLIDITAPEAPVHVSPADGIAMTNADLTKLDWKDVTDPSAPVVYYYESSLSPNLNEDGSFVSPIYQSSALATSEQPTGGNSENTYYWHVRAQDSAGNSSPWTAPWSVTIDNTPEPVCTASDSYSSGTSTYVDGHAAVAVTPHPSWATLSGAVWIWSQPLDETSSSPVGKKTFARSFTINDVPTGATLKVSADNGYVVYVNGTEVGSDADSSNWSSIDTIQIPANVLMTGENVITITADNYDRPEGYFGPNPGGLIYKLTIDTNTCETPVAPEKTVQVNIYKYLDEGDAVNMIPNESSITYQFPMRSTWNAANIGASSGSYVLGASYPGSARYSASTSPMTAPADYMTYEVTNNTDWSSKVYPATAESCPVGSWKLEGYKTGLTLAAAEAAPIVTETPSFEGIISDRYVLVVNVACSEEPRAPDPTVMVHIYKYLLKDGAAAQIQDTDNMLYLFPMKASWSADNIGSGSNQSYVLGNGHGGAHWLYAASTSVMSAPADYSTHEVTQNESVDSLVLPATAACQANTWRIVGYKTGDSLAAAQSAATSTNAPSFSGISSDKHVIVINEDCDDVIAASQFATVTMCKVDNHENHLGGWQLALTSNNGQTIAVPSNSVDGDSTASLAPGTYLATVVGRYDNGGLNSADAEFTSTSTPRWTSHAQGYPGYGEDIFDMQVNEQFVNWGTYNPSSIYTYAFTQVVAGPVNFRVFDGQDGVANQSWYGDNSGNLSVTVARTYSGVTDEESGCVTFTKVPFGSYSISEVSQSGWSNESGLTNEAVVDNAKETFTIVNKQDPVAPATGTLVVQKVLINDNGGTTATSSFNFKVNGGVAQSFEADGSNSITVTPGTYTVTEVAASGYTATYQGCSSVEVGSGQTKTCVITNNDVAPESPAPVVTTNGGGGGGNGPVVGSFGGSSFGQVLGASTSTVAQMCGDVLLKDYLRRTMRNDPAQVKILQQFLNAEMGANLPVTGVFGPMTENVVNAFQKKHASDILAPWKLTDPTGYVYKTTLWKINSIHCSDLKTPQPIVS